MKPFLAIVLVAALLIMTGCKSAQPPYQPQPAPLPTQPEVPDLPEQTESLDIPDIDPIVDELDDLSGIEEDLLDVEW